MSNLMRTGIIRMPYDMAMQSELTRMQFYDRAQSVLDELEAAEKHIEDLEDEVSLLRVRNINLED